MGKKKSKKLSSDQSNHKQDNRKGGVEILGVDAKQLGVTVAGVIVGEIVQAATQRLLEKNGGSGASDNDTDSGSNPVKAAVSKVGEQLEGVEPTVSSAAQSVKASAGSLSPNLDEFVSILKDAGQRLQEKSVNGLSNAPSSIVDGIATSARNAIEALTTDKPQSTLSKPLGKSKKKGKKKKKKK